MPTRLLAAVCVLALATTAPAADDITLKAFRPGVPIQGPKLSADDLAGKVVFVEFWGVN
jgi:hypothetical protein